MKSTTEGFIIYNDKLDLYVLTYEKANSALSTCYTGNFDCAFVYDNMKNAQTDLNKLLKYDDISDDRIKHHKIIKVVITTETVK
jgi:hypothetical protein